MAAAVPIAWTALGVPPINNGFDDRQKALAAGRVEDSPALTVYKTLIFNKDGQGTWTITCPKTNRVFMTITTTAPTTGVHKGPKTMAIYSGSPNDAQNIAGTLGDKYVGYSSASDEGEGDGKSNTQAQQPGDKIGTVRAHEVFSLSSDVTLNSHSFKMEREFYSTMGLGKLEWKTDVDGVMKKHHDNMAAGGGNVDDRVPGGDGLRSLLMLQCTYGERERVGNIVMRVRKDERPESYNDAGPITDSSTKKDDGQEKWRNTWYVTKGDFQICEDRLSEGQLQEIVASAVIETERRRRMHVGSMGGGGTMAGKVGGSLLAAIGLA